MQLNLAKHTLHQRRLLRGATQNLRYMPRLIVYIVWPLLLLLPINGWSQAPGKMLDLSDLYRLAKENDAMLRAAAAQYQATLMNRPITRAQLLPQINFNSRYSQWENQKISGRFFGGDEGAQDTSQEYNYSGRSWSLNLSQTLFNVKQYIQLKKSNSESKQAELSYAAEQQELIVRLVEAYFAVLTAEKTMEFANAQKEAVNQQLRQAQERFDVGLIAITDVKEAEAAYDLALAEEIEARNSLDNMRHRLAVIVNHDTERILPLGPTMDIRAPQPQNLDMWVETALSNNLNLLAEQIAVNIAKQAIDEQRAEHWPTLNLFAERRNNDIRGGPSPREVYENIYGVELSAPLFAGGGTYYQTRKAMQMHQQALANLERTRRETKRAARQSYLDVLSSIKRTEALARAQESAETSLQANQAGFDVGTRTSVDVLLALRELFRARLNYESVRHEYLVNSLKLKQVAGSLAEEDLLEVNERLSDQAG